MSIKVTVTILGLICSLCSCSSLREVRTANYIRFGCYRDTLGDLYDMNINISLEVDHTGEFRFCAFKGDSIIQRSEDSVCWFYKQKYIHIYRKQPYSTKQSVAFLPLKLRYTRKGLLVVVDNKLIVLHRLENLKSRGNPLANDRKKKQLGVDEAIKIKYKKVLPSELGYTSVEEIDSCRIKRRIKFNNALNRVIWRGFHWKVKHGYERPMF